jgi:orotidine-5'-phosphate decarboxylase
LERRNRVAGTATEIILALDSNSLDEAMRVVELTREHECDYKVGSILFTHHGTDSVKKVKRAGGDVFLDLKFHDIPNTVRGAVRGAARLGVRLLTVHAAGGAEMMRAAMEGAREGSDEAGEDRPLVIGVTVLTSIPRDAGTDEVVMKRAGDAVKAGIDGVVCSAHELPMIRKEYGDRLVTVVPGIRLSDQSGDDQERVATPAQAARDGADFIVVGRSVTRAADPVTTLRRIEEEIKNAG